MEPFAPDEERKNGDDAICSAVEKRVAAKDRARRALRNDWHCNVNRFEFLAHRLACLNILSLKT